MKVIFEGNKDKINSIIKMNRTFSKRNKIEMTIDEDTVSNVTSEDTVIDNDLEAEKVIRKRRTKAEIEAEKK